MACEPGLVDREKEEPGMGGRGGGGDGRVVGCGNVGDDNMGDDGDGEGDGGDCRSPPGLSMVVVVG